MLMLLGHIKLRYDIAFKKTKKTALNRFTTTFEQPANHTQKKRLVIDDSVKGI